VARELLLTGGTVRVPLAGGAVHEALLIRDGLLVAVGTERKLTDEAGSDAERVGLCGGCVLPAFSDGHVHLSGLGAVLERVELSEAESLADALKLIAQGARRLRPGEWLRGRGWDGNRWADGRPSKEALDRIVPDNPVAFSSHDGHSTWVNSLVLGMAKITRDTESPAGGAIRRDADGEPTGILSDNAAGLVHSLIPEPTDAELEKSLRAGIEHVLSYGVTRLRNCEGLRVHRLLAGLTEAGQMPLIVAGSIRPDELGEATDLLAGPLTGWRTFIENVKVFVDGALGSQTALMLEPYEDSLLGVGLEVTTPAELRSVVEDAARVGLPVAVHAIGDRAVRQTLDAIEQAAGPTVGNHSVEHAQLIDPADLPRFAELGVTASVQPSHLLTDVPICERHWGRRSRHAFPIRSLLATGARVIFGSDCPVEPIDPRRSLFAAAVRKTLAGCPEAGWYPDERISLETALACHTVPAEVGERAELVVLARDPYAEPPALILQNDILMTIVGDEVHYRGGRSTP